MEVNTIEEVTKLDNITGYRYNCTLEEISIGCDIKMYLDYTVLVLIGINAIGIGGHVDGDRMIVLLTRPGLVCTAMVLRFLILPAIGLGLTELLKLPPIVGMSVLAILVAPHEGISSLFILLLDGDLTASMAIVGANNFSTSAFLPLWAMLYEYQLYGSPGVINLPMREIFTVFGYLCAAASFGLLIRKKCDKGYDKYWEYLPTFTILTIAFVVTTQTLIHFPAFQYLSIQVVAITMLIATSGFLVGGVTGYILRQPQEITVVLCVEMGVRTTYITSILTSVSFIGNGEQNSANVVPFLVSVLSVLPAFVTVLIVRLLRTRTVFKNYFTRKEAEKCTLEEPLCSNTEGGVA